MSRLVDFATTDLSLNPTTTVFLVIFLIGNLAGFLGKTLVLVALRNNYNAKNLLTISSCIAEILLCLFGVFSSFSDLLYGGYAFGTTKCIISYYLSSWASGKLCLFLVRYSQQ
jgi:hypothetical protein